MTIVREIREAARLTQTELAERAGTSQPTIAAYESGAKVPNLRTLRRLARVVGFDLEILLTPALTREERRSLHLHRSIAQRLRDTPEQVVAAATSNLRLMRDLHPGARGLLDQWAKLLDGPVDDLLATLTSTGPRARELRQVTPFAGILNARERASIYRGFRRLDTEHES